MVKKATSPGLLQESLFSTEQAPLNLPTCEEMSRDQLLSGERRVLGTFVSGHPVDPLKAQHAGRYTHGCSEYQEMAKCDGRVVLIGMVIDVVERGRIAWVTLEDETGVAELLCFSDELTRFRFALSKWDISAVQVGIRHDPQRSPTLQLKQAARLGRFAYEPKPVIPGRRA